MKMFIGYGRGHRTRNEALGLQPLGLTVTRRVAKTAARLVLVALVASAGVGLAPPRAAHAVAAEAVAAIDFNLRNGPYFDYAQVGFVKKGTSLYVACYVMNLGRQWDLAFTTGSSAVTGFVPHENLVDTWGDVYDCTLTPMFGPVTMKVDTNLRGGPYFTFPMIGFVSANDFVNPQCHVNNAGRKWFLVYRQSPSPRVGWAPEDNINLNGDGSYCYE